MSDDYTDREAATKNFFAAWAKYSYDYPSAEHAFRAGWDASAALLAAHPATAIDREAIAEAIWRSDLDYTPKPDHWSTLTDGHRDEYRANADAVLALLASGVLNGQTESNDA